VTAVSAEEPASRRHSWSRWWRRRSLRARLTAAATIVIAVSMIGLAALLVLDLRSSLVAGIDDAARQRAQDVAAALSAGAQSPLLGSEEGEAAIQVVAADGSVVASSANIEGEPRLFTFPARGGAATADPRTVRGLPVGENGTYRAIGITAVGRGGRSTVYVALPTAVVQNSVAKLTAALSLGLPLVILVLGGIGWLLVGRALRPVEALRQQAAEITATGVQRRLDVAEPRDELARLAVTLNDMLARLEHSTNRQRQFVADAAHELRSPIAALQAQLEVAALHPGQTDWSARLPELVADTGRLSRLVDDLLRLARLDAEPRLGRQPVDLEELVFAEVRRGRNRTGLAIDVNAVSAARLTGDPDALVRVVQNLLDNAIKHAHTQVRISLVTTAGTATLVVADDGPGVPEPDRQRVFERFTRLDDARSRDAGGFGLGLAIVRDVVESHGGEVRVDDNNPGARFTVTLPTGAWAAPLPVRRIPVPAGHVTAR
jgi:signal transduction histidine kinase